MSTATGCIGWPTGCPATPTTPRTSPRRRSSGCSARWTGFQPGSFEGWLHRITTNVFLDMVRRRQRIRMEALPEETDRIAGREPSPEQVYADANLDPDLQAALDELLPEFRAAVVLCDVEGLTYEEIGATLGVKIGTVRSRIHRGRQALRAGLERRRAERSALEAASTRPARRPSGTVRARRGRRGGAYDGALRGPPRPGRRRRLRRRRDGSGRLPAGRGPRRAVRVVCGRGGRADDRPAAIALRGLPGDAGAACSTRCGPSRSRCPVQPPIPGVVHRPASPVGRCGPISASHGWRRRRTAAADSGSGAGCHRRRARGRCARPPSPSASATGRAGRAVDRHRAGSSFGSPAPAAVCTLAATRTGR